MLFTALIIQMRIPNFLRRSALWLNAFYFINISFSKRRSIVKRRSPNPARMACVLFLAVLIQAVVSNAYAQQSILPRNAEYERCFLDHVSRNTSVDGHTLIAIRQSCASVLSVDITQDIRQAISNARITGDMLSLQNNSSFHITEVCISILHRPSSTRSQICFSDFVSDMLDWVGAVPSEVHKIAREKVTIKPRSEAHIRIRSQLRVERPDFWQTHTWQLVSFRGF